MTGKMITTPSNQTSKTGSGGGGAGKTVRGDVEQLFEAASGASKLWSTTVKTFQHHHHHHHHHSNNKQKTDTDTTTTTTSATTSTKQHHQQLDEEDEQQLHRRQDDSLGMSTSSHSHSNSHSHYRGLSSRSRDVGGGGGDDDDDDSCSSSSSIRSSHPEKHGNQNQNNNSSPQVLLFQSVLHAMFSSCTTGVSGPYQQQQEQTPASEKNSNKSSNKTTSPNSNSSSSKPDYSHRGSEVSKHRKKSGNSLIGEDRSDDVGHCDLHLEEEEEEQQTNQNKKKHSNVGGQNDSGPVPATANHKPNSRPKKTEMLQRPVDVVVKSTGMTLSSATKKLFSSSDAAAAAVQAVNHLRETQAAQQQERQKQLVQTMLSEQRQRQRRHERRVHSSIVQSVATSAATASQHNQDWQDDFMTFHDRNSGSKSKNVSGPSALFNSSSVLPVAAVKDRPSSSSFFPASNPFRNKPPREVTSSPPRKPNGKAYPTISYGSSFDFDDDGVSIITQHTVDVMVQVMEKEDPTVPYIQRVFSDCTDPVDIQFAQWNDANTSAVESSQDATTPSTLTIQTSSSPPRFSRETRSTGAHSFFTKTSQSTETEDIHSVWKKEEQQYWASLVENERKETPTSQTKSRRNRGTRKSSQPKQRLEDLPEEWKVTGDLSPGKSGVPNLRLKKIRSLRATVEDRNRLVNNTKGSYAPRRVSSSTTWRKNKTVFSANSEKKEYGDEMIGFVMSHQNNDKIRKTDASDFAEI